jgi:transcriptional regulator with XRE-family HTH domain
MQAMALADLRAPDGDGVHVGGKLRHTRRLRGLTLKEVADNAGCSESLLSKIENGRATPSLKTLQRLASALGLTVGRLFAQPDDPNEIVMRATQRIRIETNDSGDKLEPLAHHSGSHLLECHLHHIMPGGGGGGNFQHEGEEFGYVLEGEIELTVGGRKYVTGKGDSFSFRSEKPHSWVNKGKTKARVLWINSPPTF